MGGTQSSPDEMIKGKISCLWQKSLSFDSFTVYQNEFLFFPYFYPKIALFQKNDEKINTH
jgi:hypothetical protein